MLCLTATLAARTCHFFSNTSVPAFVMSCVPRTLSFLRASVIPTHFTTCACTVYGRLIFLRGNKVAATAPLFVRALYRAWLPRTSHTPGAGALVDSQRFALIEVYGFIHVSRNTGTARRVIRPHKPGQQGERTQDKSRVKPETASRRIVGQKQSLAAP